MANITIFRNKLQLISWFPQWIGFKVRILKPGQQLISVYKWMVSIGYWEIRKFK